MIESSKNEYRQPTSEETNNDGHWLRLLSRLNGNWLQ
jgi:hypothetical protein